ncbi:MAG: XdhC family protein [Trueperaceae bacterium]
MSEIGELVAAFDGARAAGKRLALATVVDVQGPAYRGEGAKMLIEEGGAVSCMISGGCLEGEVATIAELIIESGTPAIHRFDLDEDVLWGLGIGCGGSIDIYIEPLVSEPVMNSWFDALRQKRPAVLATAIGGRSSANLSGAPRRLLHSSGAEPQGTLGDRQADAAALQLAMGKLDQRHPRPETRYLPLADGGSLQVFFDVNLPPPRLVLFGAGHDAIPLAEQAVKLGFEVTVVDARTAFATAERFPGARIVLSQPVRLRDRIALDHRSYAVIMNHHIERDRVCLRFALESEAPYVGVLGPLSRYQRIKSLLADEGFEPSEDQEKRIFSPIGLDLGAEPPEEVALSILAEVLALHKGHPGGFLRGHPGKIHSRDTAASDTDAPSAAAPAPSRETSR